MPIIQIPDVALKLYRRFRLESVPDSVLAPETVPVVLVEDLSDYMVEGGGRPCMGATDVPAVVGEKGFASLGNIDKKTRVRVTHITVDVDAPVQLLVQAHTNTSIAITGAPKAFLDRRLKGAPQSLFGFGSDPVYLVGIPIWGHRLLAETVYRIPIGMLLGSGEFAGNSRIVVAAVTANISFRVSMEWIEGLPEG